MAKRTILLGPNGGIMKQPVWAAVKESRPDAWTLKRYENAKFKLTLTAIDRIHSDGSVPVEHWMRFKVETFVIVTTDFEGRPIPPKHVPDIDASGSYRTKEEAEAAYQLFLARYTDSAFDTETGEFREVGNKLNPDVPKVVETSTKASAEDFGSW